MRDESSGQIGICLNKLDCRRRSLDDANMKKLVSLNGVFFMGMCVLGNLCAETGSKVIAEVTTSKIKIEGRGVMRSSYGGIKKK